uniref:Uncharacterized protein n=1 Tax=viral metagenome TaxID=1070528 RepID=A0A6C0JXX7_9ZZZZ
MKADTKAKVYAVLIVVTVVATLAALTYMMYEYSRYNQCTYNRKIWCSDNWRCENNSSQFNPCYTSATDPSGLASCLYGPDSVAASKCTDGCGCEDSYTGTPNCFSGCAANLNTVVGSTACCCNSGSECTPCGT